MQVEPFKEWQRLLCEHHHACRDERRWWQWRQWSSKSFIALPTKLPPIPGDLLGLCSVDEVWSAEKIVKIKSLFRREIDVGARLYIYFSGSNALPGQSGEGGTQRGKSQADPDKRHIWLQGLTNIWLQSLTII